MKSHCKNRTNVHKPRCLQLWDSFHHISALYRKNASIAISTQTLEQSTKPIKHDNRLQRHQPRMDHDPIQQRHKPQHDKRTTIAASILPHSSQLLRNPHLRCRDQPSTYRRCIQKNGVFGLEICVPFSFAILYRDAGSRCRCRCSHSCIESPERSSWTCYTA